MCSYWRSRLSVHARCGISRPPSRHLASMTTVPRNRGDMVIAGVPPPSTRVTVPVSSIRTVAGNVGRGDEALDQLAVVSRATAPLYRLDAGRESPPRSRESRRDSWCSLPPELGEHVVERRRSVPRPRRSGNVPTNGENDRYLAREVVQAQHLAPVEAARFERRGRFTGYCIAGCHRVLSLCDPIRHGGSVPSGG